MSKSTKPDPGTPRVDVAQLWADHPGWGEPSDYNITDQEEVENTYGQTFRLGEHVRMTEDGDEGGFTGDEGIVVGISTTGPGLFYAKARTELVVWLDEAGYAEPTIVRPDDVEHE
jgi:hypothetical protein